jgi:hypothetical protein
LPLKISARHYGENLARLDLLFSSLVRFAPRVVDELLVVARADEANQIEQHLAERPELPLRMVVEDDHFPPSDGSAANGRSDRGHRQQVIMLNARP